MPSSLADREQLGPIPAGYEDIHRRRPYNFIDAEVEDHYHGNCPERKWPNQAVLLCQELRNLAHNNPEWNVLINAAQDSITVMDSTWLEVNVKADNAPYHGGPPHRNPGRGQFQGHAQG